MLKYAVHIRISMIKSNQVPFISTKKTGSRSCVRREKYFFHKYSTQNSDKSSDDVVRKNNIACTEGKGGGILHRETKLKVTVKTTIRGTFSWVCC